MADQSVSVPMTLSDPQLGFQGRCILTSLISKKNGASYGQSYYGILIGNHTHYQIVALSMTFSDL